MTVAEAVVLSGRDVDVDANVIDNDGDGCGDVNWC